MDINIDKQHQSVPNVLRQDSYKAVTGEMECLMFGPDVEPVYYKQVGDLMVSHPLNQMLN